MAICTEKTLSPSATVNVETISVDASYCGPVYTPESYADDDVSKQEFLKQVFSFLKESANNVLHRKYAYMMVINMIKILQQLPTLVDIHVPGDHKFTVCGDIHGQFYDLMNIFEMNGHPSESNPYLFNGDFVDRGSFSVECILALFASKLMYPEHVHLARGNHETQNMNKLYGFRGEVVAKYDEKLYDLFSECFCYLPLAHVINKRVLVVHGGLFSRDGVTLDEIRSIERNREPPDDGIMTEILWSDPQENNGRDVSKRGVACQFGPDVTEAFLKNNNLDYVIRSHEMKEAGYQIEHNGKLITVFSAPNYCDQMGNKAAYIKLIGKSLNPEFVTFSEVPHPPGRPMAYASPLFKFM